MTMTHYTLNTPHGPVEVEALNDDHLITIVPLGILRAGFTVASREPGRPATDAEVAYAESLS